MSRFTKEEIGKLFSQSFLKDRKVEISHAPLNSYLYAEYQDTDGHKWNACLMSVPGGRFIASGVYKHGKRLPGGVWRRSLSESIRDLENILEGV